MFRTSTCLIAMVFASLPVAAQVQVITNGDFESGFTVIGNDNVPFGWTVHETRTIENTVISNVSDNGPSLPGLNGMDFHRPNGGGSGDWTSLEQILCLDVTTATQLDLNLDVKVISHSLYAGGCCGWEWPVSVLVSYFDTSGASHTWMWGFYSTGSSSFTNNTAVAANTWTSHTFNLLSQLTNPALIRKIRVGGSGWSYQGRADNIELITDALPMYVGSGEGLTLRTSINGGSYRCDPILSLVPGDLVVLRFDAPTLAGSPLIIGGEPFATGNPPAPILPGIHLGAGLQVIAGGPIAGLGAPLLLAPPGHFISFVWPNISGVSFLVQAVVFTPTAINGTFTGRLRFAPPACAYT